MKAQLENYNVLFVLMGICAFAVLMKAVSYGMFHKLLWDSNQMGTTRNRWMKAMMSKFEAYYKLHISVHNVENFVDRYLYHYRFWGFPCRPGKTPATIFRVCFWRERDFPVFWRDIMG